MGGCWAWAVRAGLWPALGQKSGLTLTVRASPTHHSTWTALPRESGRRAGSLEDCWALFQSRVLMHEHQVCSSETTVSAISVASHAHGVQAHVALSLCVAV